MKTTRPLQFACVSLLLILVAFALLSAGAGQSVRPASAQQAVATTGSTAIPGSQASTPVISVAISRRLTSWPHLRPRSELNRLYDAALPAPLWVDKDGRPNRNAREGLTLLRCADDDGLEPHDYGSADLDRLAATLDAARAPGIDDVASFDIALSAAMLRYFRDLHLGRIDPRSIGFHVRLPDDSHDFAALLRAAVAGDRVANATADLAPALVQYRALRMALATCRSLASADIAALPSVTVAVHPGESVLGAGRAHPPTACTGGSAGRFPSASFRYERLRRRRRPGGEAVPDPPRTRSGRRPRPGHAGRATCPARLAHPPDRARARTSAVAPRPGPAAIHRPQYSDVHLLGLGFDSSDGCAVIGMRAIVGRALNTQTPVFVEEMRQVVFRPYWNVPRSILTKEILPLLARDPSYLSLHDLEMVRGQGADAHAEADTAENHALLRQGALRLRQRPGPGNSLGFVKFVFPNDASVYVHGTPAQELFGRSRRDFSHGCVRVEDPAALAAWVLQNDPQWNRERIQAAMSGPTTQSVDLANPIQVVLFYVTAVVMPEDGTIHFAEDIYRHDLRLDRALVTARRAPALQRSR